MIAGDVRDPKTMRLALEGVDAVYHFAAAVGVGQSMYEIVNYTNINADGTAVLLEALAGHSAGAIGGGVEHERLRRGTLSARRRYVPGGARTLPRTVARARLGGARRGRRGPPACGHAGDQAPRPAFRVRAFQVLPGTALPDGRPRLRDSDRCPALLQYLRHPAGAFQSVHRGPGHLCGALPEQQAAAHQRGRRATARFRQRAGHRPGLPAGAGGARRGGPRLQRG